ncbi:MAG TPA: hypothetical protein VFZ53_01200, partial [Polyangiaceae bacterium]
STTDVLVNQRMDHGCTEESEEGGSVRRAEATQGWSQEGGGSCSTGSGCSQAPQAPQEVGA